MLGLRTIGLLLLVALSAAGPVHGQDSARTARVTAGEHYDAGGFHRFLFGSDYRHLWRAPLEVPWLDLGSFAGGLTPTTAGGGFQTKSLRFRGANGRLYGFRSVDKDPAVLPPELAGTFIDDIVSDQTSAAHPAGPALAAPLLEAAGVLHTTPRLVVLPDDPGLGQFRERFAGTLGYFEERALVEPGAQTFAGADEILGSDDLYPMIRESPAHRVDVRRFLAARLIDLLIGDWDRHRGQWQWARFGTTPVTYWVPIPEDRDQAFVRFDGLMVSLGRVAAPQLQVFGDDYKSMVGLTWNGRESDRRFLIELEKPVWDSVAAAVTRRITNDVIDRAVRGMPTEYQAIDGERMRRALRNRRDRLPQAANRFYRLLMREVDIEATDAAEIVTVDRRADGKVEVSIVERRAGASPYFHRTFRPGETGELRFHLYGGDDRVVVRGPGKGIMLRVIGGGTDELVDSSLAGRRSRRHQVRLYATAADRAMGPTPVRVDRRHYSPPPKRFDTELPPRDWGHRSLPMLWASFGPDVGVFLGGGVFFTQYGFRKLPYAYRLRLRAGWATGANTFRVDFKGTFHTVNSSVRGDVHARASGIEVLLYHGLGNETVRDRADEFFRINQEQYTVEPRLVVPFSHRVEVSFGPSATLSRTDFQAGRIIAALRPYGSGGEGPTSTTGTFAQLGFKMDFALDARDVPANASRGVYLRVGGSVFPKIWDVETTFGEAHGEVATYLSAGDATFRPTLALRAGGKRLWGTFPFQEAAFIGDARTIRLGRQNRYAGDAAVYGNAELRLRLSRIFLFLPGHIGIFGIADAGRVFLEGESSDTWHTAFGGGIWMSFVQPGNTLSAAVTRSDDERTAVYLSAGFAY